LPDREATRDSLADKRARRWSVLRQRAAKHRPDEERWRTRIVFRNSETDVTSVRPGEKIDPEELDYCKMDREINLVQYQLGICTQQSLATGKHARRALGAGA
jgi:hypothetical protein